MGGTEKITVSGLEYIRGYFSVINLGFVILSSYINRKFENMV